MPIYTFLQTLPPTATEWAGYVTIIAATITVAGLLLKEPLTRFLSRRDTTIDQVKELFAVVGELRIEVNALHGKVANIGMLALQLIPELDGHPKAQDKAKQIADVAFSNDEMPVPSVTGRRTRRNGRDSTKGMGQEQGDTS